MLQNSGNFMEYGQIYWLRFSEQLRHFVPARRFRYL